MELKEKVKNLPSTPGVYLFKNKNNKVIYVGKATSLKNRVSSYFQSGKHFDAKTVALVKNIADLEYIVTDTEAEALILEDNLIKKYKPKYNVMLRDDKTYPYIRITNEEYPRIFSTRKVVRDGSKYFGPYADVKSMKRLIKLVRTIFKLRSCKLKLTDESIKEGRFKICLDYQIKKCDGPCEGFISRKDYLENVKRAISLINGKTYQIEKELLKQMEICSEELKFEQAAYYRNQYIALKEYSEHQKVVTTELIDRDVFGFASEEDYSCVLVFNIRDGKLIGKRHFLMKNKVETTPTDILQKGIEKLYLESEFIPDEVLLPFPLEEDKFISEYLKEKKGKVVEIFVPKIGDKKKLVNLANENAQFQLKEYLLTLMKKEAEIPKRVLNVQKELRLSKPPKVIECFDNSHIQGSDYVSSVVVFKDGKPYKSGYRRFKIKTVNQNDDFAAMREAVWRRYKRLIEENQTLPDLILIDGGKGQLNEVVSVLKELGIYDNLQVISIAKKLEEIYLPGVSEPVVLPRNSPALQILQQIRDEAHRFAISYHRKLRTKRTITTELLDIKGVGSKTANKLLSQFGSIAQIKEKSIEELEKVVGKKIAIKIFEYFHPSK
ncbi:MAG: excinuclease ABC subunit UvrC [Ignavibacteria bacterium]|nr:excinuclease ABC subunit UvrC [Ignavibacteria bacterium]